MTGSFTNYCDKCGEDFNYCSDHKCKTIIIGNPTCPDCGETHKLVPKHKCKTPKYVYYCPMCGVKTNKLYEHDCIYKRLPDSLCSICKKEPNNKWHECNFSTDIVRIAIIHNREKFYGMSNIYWYRLYNGPIPSKFIKVPDTDYYEYGGTHNSALKELKKNKFKIIEGKDI